uniref:Uncharacterized protein n=1 Tax=Glycine max TaxID=3847 RepID=K7MH59_SOYBN
MTTPAICPIWGEVRECWKLEAPIPLSFGTSKGEVLACQGFWKMEKRSMLSLEYPSTRVSSLKAEDIDAKCPHVITFDVDTYVLQLTKKKLTLQVFGQTCINDQCYIYWQGWADIWGKAGTKLVCSFLFLSVPSKSSNSLGEQPSSLASRTLPDYVEHGIVQKLLLVGCSGSGTSIIFKQVTVNVNWMHIYVTLFCIICPNYNFILLQINTESSFPVSLLIIYIKIKSDQLSQN